AKLSAVEPIQPGLSTRNNPPATSRTPLNALTATAASNIQCTACRFKIAIASFQILTVHCKGGTEIFGGSLARRRSRWRLAAHDNRMLVGCLFSAQFGCGRAP